VAGDEEDVVIPSADGGVAKDVDRPRRDYGDGPLWHLLLAAHAQRQHHRRPAVSEVLHVGEVLSDLDPPGDC
jgi:hypothetical protein